MLICTHFREKIKTFFELYNIENFKKYCHNIDNSESKKRNLFCNHLNLKEIFNCLLVKLQKENNKIHQMKSRIKKQIKKNENLKQCIVDAKINYNEMKEGYKKLVKDNKILNEMKSNMLKFEESDKKSAATNHKDLNQKKLKTSINFSYTKGSFLNKK
jgi:hypothetical protein